MKNIYLFGEYNCQDLSIERKLLGGKGSGLNQMSLDGIAIPVGFTMTTRVWRSFNDNHSTFTSELLKEIDENVQELERRSEKKFGCSNNPLLLSVRSGAPVSMPGMMDTILNLGMNDDVAAGLAILSTDEFAYDSYRRFIQMYANVVLGIDMSHFENALVTHQGCTAKDITEMFKSIIQQENLSISQDPGEQLHHAIQAVFKSWMNERAVIYREIHNIPDKIGTAANVQSMVFGNLNDQSGTGVLFSRNPSSGKDKIFGEFLLNAQGEDIVSGVRTPLPISKEENSLEHVMPKIYSELVHIAKSLERRYQDVQDIEFTIENGKLYILQTRSAKRTPEANAQILVNMLQEGLISRNDFIKRLNFEDLQRLQKPELKLDSNSKIIGSGLPASPGFATGVVALSSQEAEQLSKSHDVILVKHETSPEDISGMRVAKGILTARGGVTSHAAVVARGMAVPCVCGASAVLIHDDHITIKDTEVKIRIGETITIDGSTGSILLGISDNHEAISNPLNPLLDELLNIIPDNPNVCVKANADTPKDAHLAKTFGAKGIGLCRTEHMFFNKNRISIMRKMILSDTQNERIQHLSELKKFQLEDFKEIFKAMDGFPVNVRLLDPPLHEFLPNTKESITSVASSLGIDVERLTEKVEILNETNPMLGLRGCRLGILYPEIYQMQIESILEAGTQMEQLGITAYPEIMVPLATCKQELQVVLDMVTSVKNEIMNTLGRCVQYKFGTMIELPSAALRANEIAEISDFFSFGTNDLTQTTLGISRDDVASFMQKYKDKRIFAHDPFMTTIPESVGELIRIACEKGLQTNPNLIIGVCGEHGGDPDSINLCYKHGVQYFSCSPHRVIHARLAAAKLCVNL